jgi:hypothetical protein
MASSQEVAVQKLMALVVVVVVVVVVAVAVQQQDLQGVA